MRIQCTVINQSHPGFVLDYCGHHECFHINICSVSLQHSSTSFGWGKGGNVTSAGWQVTLCDPIWHVSPRSGEACCKLLCSAYFYLYLQITPVCSTIPSHGFICTSAPLKLRPYGAIQICLIIIIIIVGGSVAKCLACWTQAQKGPGSNRSRDAVW